MGYFQHPVKCLACGLHFVVCSDYEDWPDKGTTRDLNLGEATGVIYCPECGNTEQKILWGPRNPDGFIFEEVPGSSREVRKMTLKRKEDE